MLGATLVGMRVFCSSVAVAALSASSWPSAARAEEEHAVTNVANEAVYFDLGERDGVHAGSSVEVLAADGVVVAVLKTNLCGEVICRAPLPTALAGRIQKGMRVWPAGAATDEAVPEYSPEEATETEPLPQPKPIPEVEATKATSASLPPPVDTKLPPSRDKEHWYGGQIIGVVYGSGLLLAVGVAASSGGIASLGGIGYALGGPLVHFAHGEVGRGFGSIGIMVGCATAGAIVGVAGGKDGPAYGAIIGLVAAPILDSLRAYEPVTGGADPSPEPMEKKAKNKRRLGESSGIVPSVVVGRGGVTFGLSATF
jgi:hypothetical protein